ncbi:MAG: ATP-dependent helicase HrpB, partial [Proteobacteria bacterium]|nr:ATP-dependent helicase HrpB [Pseudomonadota bacterium]
VAETSVTIDGVVCVIDSGLARIARHSPWSGLPSLQIEPVSRASCTQRAGRAGRTRPGRVLRLYTRHDHDGRRAFEAAEIGRTDLSGAALELYGAGLAGLGALRWFEAPPAVAAAAADELLGRLGAITDGPSGAKLITPLGRRMLRFPVHPRQGRLVCEAEDLGVDDGCTLAALLGARELRLDRRGPNATARVTSTSDLLDDLDAIAHKSRDLDRTTAQVVERTAQQLRRIARAPDRSRDHSIDRVDEQLKLAILAAYPDRVGKRRAPRSAEFVFAGGGSGTLAPSSAVLDAELIVAVDVAETGTRGQASKVQIRRASAIDASWLLGYEDRIAERDELAWNAAKQRVERLTRVVYDGLAIDETRDVEGARRAGPAAAAILAREAIAAGIEQFVDADALAQWRARVTLVARIANKPELVAPTDEALGAIVARACEGCVSFAELRTLGLMAMIDAGLGEHRALVNRLAPLHLDLPRRKHLAINYTADQPPWIASRMQDFFGLARAPAVGDGRVPLVLHLLAPNQRPVQVTQDLPGFWVRHYPALRKQLARRYPRHQWPEDPTQLINE